MHTIIRPLSAPQKPLATTRETIRESVSSILWVKCLGELKNSPLSSIAKTTGKIALSLVVSVILVDIAKGLQMLGAFLAWHDFAPCKVAFSFCLVFGWGHIVEMSRVVSREVREDIAKVAKIATPPDQRMIYQVGIASLVDMIVNTSAFRYTDARALGLSRSQYDTIATGLESVVILTRGESNSRVLVEGTSRENIEKSLLSASQ